LCHHETLSSMIFTDKFNNEISVIRKREPMLPRNGIFRHYGFWEMGSCTVIGWRLGSCAGVDWRWAAVQVSVGDWVAVQVSGWRWATVQVSGWKWTAV
jgi:hypothetical protein